ncbi:MAG TPA: flavin reductase family protein [Planctomycetota bacterium]|nr:flavin reductase family protein [Planctomycetota bacterium]
MTGAEARTRAGIDPPRFRRALGRFASGVTVVTTAHEGGVHGMTVNGFVSVSLEPPLVLVSLRTTCRMSGLLERSQRYGVSVLAEHHEGLSRHFSARPLHPLEPEFVWQPELELPFIDGALVHVGCRVVDVHPAGDHTLFIGRVEHLDDRGGRPLLFFGGSYTALRPPEDEGGFWL